MITYQPFVPTAHKLETIFSREDDFFGICWKLEALFSSWTSLCDLRIPRCLGTLVSVNERLFLCGGATRSYNFKNSVLSSVASIDEYDFERNGWNHVTDLLVPRHDMGVAVVGKSTW